MDKINKKILIVEDDKDFLLILRHSFADQPFSIVYAESGEEGLNLAKKEQPDLIIIDIILPKMNGIDMAKKIREEGIKSKIIFLTNLKDIEHIGEAIDAVGEADYIVKSDVHMDAIVSRVRDHLKVE